MKIKLDFNKDDGNFVAPMRPSPNNNLIQACDYIYLCLKGTRGMLGLGKRVQAFRLTIRDGDDQPKNWPDKKPGYGCNWICVDLMQSVEGEIVIDTIGNMRFLDVNWVTDQILRKLFPQLDIVGRRVKIWIKVSKKRK